MKNTEANQGPKGPAPLISRQLHRQNVAKEETPPSGPKKKQSPAAKRAAAVKPAPAPKLSEPEPPQPVAGKICPPPRRLPDAGRVSEFKKLKNDGPEPPPPPAPQGSFFSDIPVAARIGACVVAGIVVIGILLAVTLVNHKPKNEHSLIDDSRTHLEQEDYDGALALAQKAGALAPNDPAIWNLTGLIYIKMKRFNDADACLKKALALQPDMPAATLNVGELYFVQGQYEKALNIFRQFVHPFDKEHPPQNDSMVVFKCMVCSLLAGHKEDARGFLDQISATDLTPSWYYANAVWEAENGNWSRATRYANLAHISFGAGATSPYEQVLLDIHLKIGS